ncbi:hypothetical protein JOC36_000768 [Weissella uvarum]|uniref:hypothetical protein n=1 Tax=Weissella uvarum TaxID=1479233 RepID=UPI0019620709|nr:hypothetical protein [Weissella uvarum]MBM7617219.1 hypothetical protein [Weissella uvarum]MCM0595512.1 hypothetical protein [Weissella uvarum]
MTTPLKDKLIDINVKTKGTETSVIISTLGTIGTIAAALTGSALVSHVRNRHQD